MRRAEQSLRTKKANGQRLDYETSTSGKDETNGGWVREIVIEGGFLESVKLGVVSKELNEALDLKRRKAKQKKYELWLKTIAILPTKVELQCHRLFYVSN
ncbi:hypothetical protein PIB30_069674 [Stylosanthes scabra]|uniref:Uncharacterized protein n=1 Tax=Stylosanthes scabra TaxID=79078 RepID=A0ABU6SNU0_9FABA|nr:hypothetical protein [Stylosanthes scabra]